jgi:hypothetical protein
MRHLVLALAVLLAVPAMAWADDYNPPPWRGDPGWTYARWEFMTPDLMPPPDQWDNPFGPPELEVNPFGDGWMPGYQGREGVWPLSGEIWVDIFNYPEPNDEKWIWVQLTWAPMMGEPTPFPNVEEIFNEGGPYPGMEIDRQPAFPGDWTYSTFLIELPFNPQFETVYIWGDIYVDELVIDTICIPEPTSMAMLLGGCVLVLRRRR